MNHEFICQEDGEIVGLSLNGRALNLGPIPVRRGDSVTIRLKSLASAPVLVCSVCGHGDKYDATPGLCACGARVCMRQNCLTAHASHAKSK